MTASPLTAADAAEMVQRLSAKLTARQAGYAELDEAYKGKHKATYLSESFKKFIEERYRGFSDNWCGVVANSPAERLSVIGFGIDSDAGQSEAEKALWRSCWLNNQLDVQSSQGLLESLIASRSYVLVWGDPDTSEPVVTWEHPSQVIVAYDPANPRLRVAALKTWLDEDESREYATLYTSDDVWKWERPTTNMPASFVIIGDTYSGNWTPRQPVGDDTWPLPNPMGEVPIVEVPNRPMLGGEPISEIGGAMSMQKAINLLWTYLFNAADFASLPQRVVMGQEPPKIPILDDNGVVVGERQVPLDKLSGDRLLWLTGQNTTIGQWDPANLVSYTDVTEVAVGHLAAQTRTPQHYLIGKMANLSADALKAAETGLVKKVEEAQLFYGAAIRDVFRLSAVALGDQGLADQARYGVVRWKDAESRSEAQLVDALTKLQGIGFPFAWLAERYGLGPYEIQRVLDMRAADLSQVFGDATGFKANAGVDPNSDVAA